jgi:hypothetical protein
MLPLLEQGLRQLPVAATVHSIADRFRGVPAPDPYVPTGQNDIDRLECGG